ncbi:MAG TPA: HAMP domain-containing sensor histidine kinase [Rhizomicrobium sp.]|nr:HAMP domain-containing sensor histidine kinase [Rhizomicrobium sp.]
MQSSKQPMGGMRANAGDGSILAGVKGLRESFRRSFAPTSHADLRLVDLQLDMGRKASAPLWIVLTVSAVLLAAANYNWVWWPWLIAFVALAAGANIGLEFRYRQFMEGFDHSPEAVRERARIMVMHFALMSAAWCSMGFFLWAPGILSNHMLVILFLACTLSGWASIGSYHLATCYATLPFYLLALTFPPIFGGDWIDLMLAGTSAGFWMLMTTNALANYDTNEKMLRLEDERERLIGDLKKAKDLSDRARDRAETASRAKSDFLANVSHELRSPLNAILGFSEIVSNRMPGASLDQYSEYGGYIHEAGSHLLALINDILDLSKIEAGRLTLQETEVDVTRVFEDCVRMMRVRAEKASVLLSIHVEQNFPRLHADERAMRQIVVNLVSNGIKFTPGEGRVKLFARMVADRTPAFGVVDSGVGIAPEDLNRVFESFGQGRHEALVADKGTGLGLPIVRGLVEAHGGSVKLESTQGQGTSVTILLPKHRAVTPEPMAIAV